MITLSFIYAFALSCGHFFLRPALESEALFLPDFAIVPPGQRALGFSFPGLRALVLLRGASTRAHFWVAPAPIAPGLRPGAAGVRPERAPTSPRGLFAPIARIFSRNAFVALLVAFSRGRPQKRRASRRPPSWSLAPLVRLSSIVLPTHSPLLAMHSLPPCMHACMVTAMRIVFVVFLPDISPRKQVCQVRGAVS